jgi:hypothetical protein
MDNLLSLERLSALGAEQANWTNADRYPPSVVWEA